MVNHVGVGYQLLVVGSSPYTAVIYSLVHRCVRLLLS